jgi:hypothetical protein
MKITITEEFKDVNEAHAFLERVFGGPPMVTQNISGLQQEPVAAATEPVKKLRKPRSDAGQPRGPYKTTGEPAASEPDTGATSVVTPSAAPATPTTPAVTAAQAVLTVADVRAAMEVLNKKRGIEANMKLLAKFGVQRASDLPKEKYAEFIDAARKASS